MDIYLAAALAAATCWSVAGFVSAGPAKHLGAIAFNRVRLSFVFIMLSGFAWFSGGWASIDDNVFLPLICSGFVGVFLGDTALFLTLNRMGPRRTAILFGTNAPMAAVLGWWWLGESLNLQSVLGIVLTVAGVVLAVIFGKRQSQLHQWEEIRGALWVGVLLGLAAALSQAVGSLLARPAMLAGADPVAASALRVGVGALGLTVLMSLPVRAFKRQGAYSAKVLGTVAITGLLGMAIGMTLLLFALRGGEVGIVSTLSSTSPVIQLPLLWWLTKECPAKTAWIGAGLVIIGTALIFTA